MGKRRSTPGTTRFPTSMTETLRVGRRAIALRSSKMATIGRLSTIIRRRCRYLQSSSARSGPIQVSRACARRQPPFLIATKRFPNMSRDLVALMHRLGPEFAARAGHSDNEDLFVAENYVALKNHGVLRAGLPVELGGGGAEHRELGEMLRVLARHCGSTALALSMHTHQAATADWRWRRDPVPLEMLLRNVASNDLILVSSGGSDWIAGSGTAERVDGGWRITARKIFASGVPIGDILVTSAVWHDPESGPTVLHFPLPIKSDGVKVL